MWKEEKKTLHTQIATISRMLSDIMLLRRCDELGVRNSSKAEVQIR